MTPFRPIILALMLATGLAILAPALAHEDHVHAAKYGGKVVASGHHDLEIVARDGALEVYVTGDGGHTEDIAKAKATAVVLSEGKTEQIVLAPSDGNVLKGAGSFRAVKGTTIVLTLTMPGHEAEQARLRLE